MINKILPLLGAACLSLLSPCLAVADTPTAPLTIRAKHKPSDTAWKEYTVRAIEKIGTLSAEPSVDRFGGRLDKTGIKTGYFHAQKIGPRWWLVDPDGHLYLNVAVVGVGPNSSASTGAGQAAGAMSAATLLRSNGFNGLGAWSATEIMRAIPQPLVYTLIGQSGLAGKGTNGFMGSFASMHKISHAGTGHSRYPNDCIPVFHPEFAAYCDSYAQPLAAFKDDPYLLGYFSDNELPLPTLDNYLALDPNDPQLGSSCKAAKDWLAARQSARPGSKEITQADRDAWTEYVFDRYFSITTAAIRKYDPHHLCLGSRLHGRPANTEAVFRAAGHYLDVIAINYYNVWNPSIASVRNRTIWSDKPILITEFYAKAVDSGLANTNGAGWLVETQRERGLFYQTYTLGLLEAQNCVGWQWFKYMDNDPANLSADPSNRDANKGIVTIKLAPYTPLLDLMRPINQNVYALADTFDHMGAGPASVSQKN